MTTARFETVSTIVNEALVELGLSESTAVDVFASTDPKYVRARTLLKACGQELIGMDGANWQSLHKTHSFTAVAAVAPALYGVNALPTDLDRYIPQTAWNQTDDERVTDATPQMWEAALVSVAPSTRSYGFLDADRLLLYPTAAGDTITIRYQSRYWLATTGTVTPALAAPAANTDVVLFTPLLIKRLLKLRMAQALKLSYAEELADFESTLASEMAKHAPAPVLSVTGAGLGVHFIDRMNVPDTGYGS